MYAEEMIKRLESSEDGLSEAEATKRIGEYGYNEIEEKKKSRAAKFLSKFIGPIPFMLEIVIIISFVLRKIDDFSITLALLIFNALVSYKEESGAEKTVEMLKEKIKVKTRVLRDGSWKLIDAKLIVPGDVIRLRFGDIAPADSIIMEDSSLFVDESQITGESFEVEKKKDNKIYSGSVIKRGEAKCIVVATGKNSEYGKVIKLVNEARAPSHLERSIENIALYLIIFDILVIAFIMFYALEFARLGIGEMLTFGIVILLASVPVALPTAFTVAMAIGVRDSSKKGALITKLGSMEEISNVDILCVDKTGTITENKMSVKGIFPIGKHSEKEILTAALMASREEDNDPIDNAIIEKCKELEIKREYAVEKFFPFQPEVKYTCAVYKRGAKREMAIKGSVSSVIEKFGASKEDEEKIESHVRESAQKGNKVLCVAKGTNKVKVIGLIDLYDPPRKDAKRFIEELKGLGIKIKMLTGDNIHTAGSIAKELGIEGKAIDSRTLKGLEEKEAEAKVEEAAIFAEVYPEDKMTIVKTLQKKGYKVAMTGDGINDAPALKQAEVGIAVEDATSVAKSAASIVLVRNGLEGIIEAIKNSRKVFERMLTYSMIKIVKVIQIVLYAAFAFLIIDNLPILPFQLILLIFTNDIVNISLARDNVSYSKSPDEFNERGLFISSIPLGIYLFFITLAFVPVSMLFRLSLGSLQSYSFFILVLTDNLLLFSLRRRSNPARPSRVVLLSTIGSIVFAFAVASLGIFIKEVPIKPMAFSIVLCSVLMLVFDRIKKSVLKEYEKGQK
ncbi:MAG: plasma-membrane proton-efflux P-type ATPase [Candidatus Micrarchaeaceae archaeon]